MKRGMRNRLLAVLCLAALAAAGCTSGNTEEPQAGAEQVREEASEAQAEETAQAEPEVQSEEAEQESVIVRFESENGWYVEYDTGLFAVSGAGDAVGDAQFSEKAVFDYIGEGTGTNRISISYYPEIMPGEALYDAMDTGNGLPEHERTEGYFAGRTDVWSLRTYVNDAEEAGNGTEYIAVEHNGGTLLLEVISHTQEDGQKLMAVSNAMTDVLSSFTFTDHEPQTEYDYVPGRYEQDYEEEMNGTKVSVTYYVQLNEDHTGVVSFQDEMPVIWFCRDGRILDPGTGEQIYEYDIEGDTLYLMEGDYVFEFTK